MDKNQAGGEGVFAHELAVWLPALRSFFVLDNYPLEESGRLRPHARNFINDARIVRQVLRRCLLLCLSESPAGGSTLGEDLVLVAAGASPFPGERLKPEPSALAWQANLTRVLGDLSVVCGSLVERGEVSFRAWMGLGSVVNRELERAGVAASEERKSPLVSLSGSQPELLRLASGLDDESFAGGVLVAFALLTRALGRLELIESLMRSDRPLKQALPIFTLVHEDARAASVMLERLSLLAAEEKGGLYEVLDSAVYALGMELKKVFCRELVGYSSLRSPNEIYGKTETCTYLLLDCCQQTTVALAQTLDSSLDCARLFQSITIKIQESLRLREELWGVLEAVRRAERERDRSPLAPLVARLRDFQSGGMRYLMYKDWESSERFVAEVSAARGPAELAPVLHRFGAYLEALFTQVNMRAVLAEYPFETPPSQD